MSPEPYPAKALAHVPSRAPGPDPRYGMHESLEPVFVGALEHLAPGERAALLLRDVLGYGVAEVAEMLELSGPGTALIILRARRRFERQLQLGSGS
jgi:RNA polymerase sigma-70 factor (ECF subfamily)